MSNSNLDPLITDRTYQDVVQGTEKGFYNVSDVQRVNSYVQYLSDGLGLNLTVTDVSLGQVLTFNQMQSIINNVNTIRSVWYVSSDTPYTPIAINWTYSKANDLEKILYSMNSYYQLSLKAKIFSGTFRAGSQIKFRGHITT